MGFICPCFVLDFVELAGHLFRSLCRSGSRRSAAIVPSGQEPLAPPDVFQHGALIQWQISKEGARDPALLLFGRGSRFGDEPLRPLADVRITPESGRVADIGGCRKRATTGLMRRNKEWLYCRRKPSSHRPSPDGACAIRHQFLLSNRSCGSLGAA